ncbi:TIGR03546 family protein [Cysteiniphilum halobium]|uniref:TIGR03546 family protein n=1 Tax=Cysteiniphilum halobium TaxID=2219059 RepID=UPI0013C34163|nr:TIGR03546 family protein [Cysteiniphilum halobium]
MKFIKKLMAIITGQSNPMQLFLAALFGFALGFMPGFQYAPLIYLVVILLLLLLNVNLVVAAIVFAIAEILSFVLEFLSYHLGTWLLDGFLQPFFKWMINAPVLAYAGFDYYLVSGSFVLSIILGLILGFVLARFAKNIKTKMAALQTEKESYARIINKRSIKIVSWAVFGKSAHKIDWVKLRDKKLKHPFRWWGVIVTVVIVILLFVMSSFLQSQVVKNILLTQLTKVNDATVDIGKLNIEALNGKLVIKDLAFANPDNLFENRFYAKELSAKVNMSALLAKRIELSNVVVDSVLMHVKRQNKASLYTATSSQSGSMTIAKDKSKTSDMTDQGSQSNKTKHFDVRHYINNANEYYDNLAKVMRVIKWLAPEPAAKEDKPISTENSEAIPVYQYAQRQALHLVEKTPTLMIAKLMVNNIHYNDALQLNVKASNLSTQPWLTAAPTKINITNIDKTVNVDFVSANNSRIAPSFSLMLKDMSADKLLSDIKFGNNFNLTAKTYDITMHGYWAWQSGDIHLDMPANITFYHAKVTAGGVSQTLAQLPLKFNVTGSLSNPVIAMDNTQLQNLLIESGTSAVKDRLKNELKNRLPIGW